MVIGCTSHHIFVNIVSIYDSPEMSPNIIEYIIMFRLYAFNIRVMFLITKLYKVAELPRMFNSGIIEECPDGVPHHVQFI